MYWLANTTVRETKDLPPEVLTQLYRAALENTAPSPLLIKPILAQLQSHLFRDENYNLIYDQSRFALLKLIVNRNRKETDMKIDPYLTARDRRPRLQLRASTVSALRNAKKGTRKTQRQGLLRRCRTLFWHSQRFTSHGLPPLAQAQPPPPR